MHAQVSTHSDAHLVSHEEAARDSTRPIRALNRGLDVLTELNRLERAAINTLAAAVGLPRTTTYRIWKPCVLPDTLPATPTMTATGRRSWYEPCRTGSTTKRWLRTSPSRCSPSSVRKLFARGGRDAFRFDHDDPGNHRSPKSSCAGTVQRRRSRAHAGLGRGARVSGVLLDATARCHARVTGALVAAGGSFGAQSN